MFYAIALLTLLYPTPTHDTSTSPVPTVDGRAASPSSGSGLGAGEILNLTPKKTSTSRRNWTLRVSALHHL